MSKTLTPAEVLKGLSPLILTATLEPVAGDRFQPAGFPEIGHVIYKAPRKDGTLQHVCIVDSAASMANHLESVCQRGAHDLDLVEELDGLPFVRCVTDPVEGAGPSESREVVVTSLTEGHRIASSYFLDGIRLDGGTKADHKFSEDLIRRFGIVLSTSSKAHPPAAQWWNVFKAIFELDPNSLVHGVLFPKWQIKIPRSLTAHLEAFGAGRVDRSGVKFDRLGKTNSGQPIFAVDDATAECIRATFVLDVGLIRSFGRKKGDDQLGISDKQQELLVALALCAADPTGPLRPASPRFRRTGFSCLGIGHALRPAKASPSTWQGARARHAGQTDPARTQTTRAPRRHRLRAYRTSALGLRSCASTRSKPARVHRRPNGPASATDLHRANLWAPPPRALQQLRPGPIPPHRARNLQVRCRPTPEAPVTRRCPEAWLGDAPPSEGTLRRPPSPIGRSLPPAHRGWADQAG